MSSSGELWRLPCIYPASATQTLEKVTQALEKDDDEEEERGARSEEEEEEEQ